MSTSVTFNGVSYIVPAISDASWGTNVSSYLIAISTGCLQKTGGSFTLSSADVDFGGTYGLKAVYFKSKSANIASAGVLILANADAISWRNAANSADKTLTVNSSDLLTYAGNPILTLALGAANTVLTMNSGGTGYAFTALVNANVDAAAAIAGTKISPIFGAQQITTTSNMGVGTASPTSGVGIHIALASGSGHLKLERTGTSTGSVFVGSGSGDFRVGTTAGGFDMFSVNSSGSPTFPALNSAGVVHTDTNGTFTTSTIVNADVNASAAIAYSKLSLTGSIVNADISASAAIAYSKLSLTGAIVNADISSSAAIAYSKLSLTGNIVNADISASAAIARSKIATGTAGQVVINDGSTGALSSEAQLAISRGGTGQATANAALNALLPDQSTASGKVLTSDGTNTAWGAALTTTLTSAHIFVGDGTNTAASVTMSGDIGIDNTGSTSIQAGKITDSMVNASAAIAGTKISPDFGSQSLTTTGKVGFGAAADSTAQLVLSQASASTQLKLTRSGTSAGSCFIGTGSGDFRVGTTAGGTDIFNVNSSGIGKITKLGIGTNATYALDVVSAGGASYVAHFQSTTTATPYTVWIEAPGSAVAGYPLLSVSGSGGSTVCLQVNSGGNCYFPSVATTSSSANAVLDSGFSNSLLRSTSSARYKTNIQPLPDSETSKIWNLRPVSFNSLSTADNPTQTYYGMVAEEVAEHLPHLVGYIKDESGNMIPDSFHYDRLAVLLLAEMKKLKAKITALELKVNQTH